jgi:sec-independent protein translocase protein TatA
MPNIGFSELVVILLILMLVFGASRLPKLGESMGKAIRNFKRAVAQNEHIQVSELNEDERKRLNDGRLQDSQDTKGTKGTKGNDAKAASEIVDAEVIDDKRAG